MRLSDLPKTSSKAQKRLGRGHGSGKGGHTSSRGSKGQKARSDINIFFEGTKFKKSFLKRLPLFRGKGKFKPGKPPSIVINLKYLNLFKSGEEVNLISLKEKGILPKDFGDNARVKILGDGEIQKPLTVNLPVSKGAKKKIEKAGGKITSGKEIAKEEKIKESLNEAKEQKRTKKEIIKKTVKAKEK